MHENQHPSDLNWQWLQLAEMSPQLLYRLLAFRESIFVVEQACPYQELDGRDEQSWHLLGERQTTIGKLWSIQSFCGIRSRLSSKQGKGRAAATTGAARAAPAPPHS